ncbi:MAG: AAA family ATPase [Planctomycetes bacterium]|nr:AAA family ATPase [Planctomycetota bacterium]
MSNDAQHLRQILIARHPCVTIHTYEEQEALGVIRDTALALGRPLWIWSGSGGVQEGLLAESPPLPQTEDAAAAFAFMASRDHYPIFATLDLCGFLRNDRVLRAFRNLLNHCRNNGAQIVLIDHDSELPPVIRATSVCLELSLPSEQELETLVRSTLRRENESMPVQVDISRRGLQAIVRNLAGLSRRQAEQVVRELVAVDRRFDDNDVNHVVAAKRRALFNTGLLEFIETPVDLSEIGGLKRLKSWLKQRQDCLSQQAVEFGLPAPRGVLLLGVQGAGKSLCAKAIATAWRRPLLRMDVGALYDRYVGESERRLRDAFRQAEQMAPLVLWVDEIEKAFASAASRSTDGGLSQRMFGSLLTWMQEHQQPVFLVATANDIEALPPELLRKGRFDEIFFVDLPDEKVRREILKIHLKRRGREPAKFDLAKLAAGSDGYSGAEIEQAIVASLHDAFASGKELDTPMLLGAISNSPPLSVTMAERVAALRAWAASRCVPAD